DFTGPNEESIADVPLEFMWGVPEIRGPYRAMVDLPAAGAWSVQISAEGMAASEPTMLMVNAETPMPQIGDRGPRVETPTGADTDLNLISSDPEPNPDFYRLSLDDALDDDRPTIVVFATPAF